MIFLATALESPAVLFDDRTLEKSRPVLIIEVKTVNTLKWRLDRFVVHECCGYAP